MNCPKCYTYMTKPVHWSTTAGFVFFCSKCVKRYSEQEIANWGLCAACGDILQEDNESLCPRCIEKLQHKPLSYE